MELTTICLTALIIGFLLIGNSPIQMPREAWGYTLAMVFFAVIGGASFFGQIIHTALPALRQTHEIPEDYFEHIAKVLHHGRVKFSAPDHHFNHEFGICCDQESHCISCLDLQDEEYGEIQAFLRMLHNSPVTAGTCQALAQMPAICPNKASNIKFKNNNTNTTHYNHNNDFRIRMNSLERNKTTAEQARMLEDAPNHSLRPGVPRPAEYYKILQSRRELPVSAMRQEFLDAYHKSKRYLKVLVLVGETGSGKTTQVPHLTIDGIVYVIDTGIEMHSSYNPRGDMETLDNAEISKAATRQRAGRAGRTRPGVCFRLYTKEAFDEDFAPGKTPGILSCSISQEVLQLMYMGNHNVARFDFIDPPDTEAYLRSLHELNAMGYIDDNAKITHVGKMAAQIPVHPVWYNAIVEGQKLGCGVEMVALAALGSTQDPVLLHPPRVAVARVAHTRFTCPNSDHITNLHALHAYVRTKIQGNIDMAQWCFDAFIDQRVMEEVLQIREQLKAKVQNISGQPLTSALFDDGYELKIRKALARSLYTNSAIEKGEDVYMTVHDAVPAIVPLTSALFKQGYSWVVFDKLIKYGSKIYLQNATAIDPEWLADLPFFQDDKLSVKRDEARTIRQPYVKESQDAARARLQSNDTAANSSLCTLTRQAGPKPAPEPMGLDKERQAQAPQGADTVKDALPLVSGALASMALTKFPGDWYHVPMKPDLPVSSFTSYMLKVEGLYKAAGVVARPVISINGPGILHSTPVSSPAPQNNPFSRGSLWSLFHYTSGCQKDDRRPPRHQDVLNHDAPYKDTAHLFSSPIKMHKLCSGVDLQPGQLLGRDPEARSPMSQSTTFVKPSELSASTSSATCRAHMMKYSTPPIVGPDWGDHSRFRQWQLHGRTIKPDMVPNKTWDTTVGSSLEFILDGDAPGAAQKITVDEVGLAKFGIFRDIAPRSVADAMNRKTTAAEKRPKHRKETPQDKINKQTGSSRDW
ncbi:hypothetical protein FANTH_9845 [Fusarium anthophilum]|uniref:Helicase-associated domain-containing protein n=1 Tax=Fusarium anthophilum TaxID=48485 RepID=A0A8H5DY79_9HYPO|nr:hypothetical protein FANTH_9845 [Fusarium anthophilum]